MNSHFWTAIALMAVVMNPVTAAAKSGAPISSSEAREEQREKVSALLAKPITLIYDGNIAGGQAQFEALLAETRRKHGESSAEAADLLSLFGIYLAMAGIVGDERLKAIALHYSEASVAASRAAFGSNHPEVAEALQSYAAILGSTNREDPPLAVDKLLEEALQIRRAALGEDNQDTRQLMKLLAANHGLVGRTARDPARVAVVAAEFERLIALSPVVTHGNIGDSAAAVRFELAAMYARNGMIDQAVVEAAKARTLILSWPDDYRCAGIELLTGPIERALKNGGDKQPSATRARIIKASPTDCAADLLP